jgi:hypothetical protein
MEGRQCKGSILARTIDYIRHLQNSNDQLRAGTLHRSLIAGRRNCNVALVIHLDRQYYLLTVPLVTCYAALAEQGIELPPADNISFGDMEELSEYADPGEVREAFALLYLHR